METIWIDALEFDNYGGFIKDTQFVGEIFVAPIKTGIAIRLDKDNTLYQEVTNETQ